MLPSLKKRHGTSTNVPSKREEKKGINIRWNSGLFFQIGLIVSLLLTFAVMNVTVGYGKAPTPGEELSYVEDPPFSDYRIAPPKRKVIQKTIEKKPEPRKEVKKVGGDIKVMSNDDPTIETKTGATDTPDQPIAPTNTGPELDTTPRTMKTVEEVPIFPGCESLLTNEEKTKCMSEKIRKFISRRFSVDDLDSNGNDILNIYVQFTIDRNGDVADMRARAPYPALEKEAMRVIGKLPKMTPGKQGNQNVNVIYGVPIKYQIE